MYSKPLLARPAVSGAQIGLPLLLFFNVAMTAMFFGFRWNWDIMHADHMYEKAFVGVVLTLLAGTSLRSLARPARCEQMLSIQLAYASVVVTLCAIELVTPSIVRAVPSSSLLARLQLEIAKRGEGEVLEYLADSPWVKFKANTKVESPEFRGADFTPNWVTDSLGFKNLPGLSEQTPVLALAAGDSFVEGMGVPIADTWTSILNRKGLTVYNVGVQGYAPQQILGTIQSYGPRFRPRVVIFGYTPGFEGRALDFQDSAADGRNHRGVIVGLNNYLAKRHAEQKRFPVINTVLSLAKQSVTTGFLNAQAFLVGRLDGGAFRRYRYEVESEAQVRFDPNMLQWKLTTEALLEAKEATQKMGATLVLVAFAHRPLLYHERVTGRPAPDSHIEIETIRALKRFCATNNIGLIETHGAFQAYMASLPSDVAPSQLPFFEMDGHLNRIGNAIVADVVYDYLTGNAQLQKDP